jgi:hypothetical protein
MLEKKLVACRLVNNRIANILSYSLITSVSTTANSIFLGGDLSRPSGNTGANG